MQSELSENEIGSGVLQSSVQQTRVLQEHYRYKLLAVDYVPILPLMCETSADCMFVERWTR